jgi:hypothetical protein
VTAETKQTTPGSLAAENATLRAALKQTAEALSKAENHLDWIGWGDSYERRCAYDDKLPERIEAARIAACEALK